MHFECPYCKESEMEHIDDRFFSSECIQGSDALNADPLSNSNSKIELWYCCFCGQHYRVYYKIDRITKLEEENNEVL